MICHCGAVGPGPREDLTMACASYSGGSAPGGLKERHGSMGLGASELMPTRLVSVRRRPKVYGESGKLDASRGFFPGSKFHFRATKIKLRPGLRG